MRILLHCLQTEVNVGELVVKLIVKSNENKAISPYFLHFCGYKLF